MHPPSAAEIVAPRLKSMPIAAAVSKKVKTSRSGSCEMNSTTYLHFSVSNACQYSDEPTLQQLV